MSKKRQETEKEEGYTAADAVELVVEFVVVAPVWWLFDNTVGWMFDA